MNSTLPANAYKDTISRTTDVQSCCSGERITCSSGEEFETFSCSLRETEIFPNIQSKPPLMQLEAPPQAMPSVLWSPQRGRSPTSNPDPGVGHADGRPPGTAAISCQSLHPNQAVRGSPESKPSTLRSLEQVTQRDHRRESWQGEERWGAQVNSGIDTSSVHYRCSEGQNLSLNL